jgi:rSAM/selenodomain-associated transferase 1
VVVLAKAPRPGVSKTRLSAAVGPEGASRLAEAFLRDTVAMAAPTCAELIVSFTPRSAGAEIARLAPGARLHAQPDGDLGCRIEAALAEALRTAGSAVLIGSDTPDMPPRILTEALGAVAGEDVVLGPSVDGGFYLIGASSVRHRLFDGVAWSTSTVFATVRANAGRHGLHVAVLEPWEDIDDLVSLQRAAGRIFESGRAPETRRALETIGLSSSAMAAGAGGGGAT